MQLISATTLETVGPHYTPDIGSFESQYLLFGLNCRLQSVLLPHFGLSMFVTLLSYFSCVRLHTGKFIVLVTMKVIR